MITLPCPAHWLPVPARKGGLLPQTTRLFLLLIFFFPEPLASARSTIANLFIIYVPVSMWIGREWGRFVSLHIFHTPLTRIEALLKLKYYPSRLGRGQNFAVRDRIIPYALLLR